jgi:hypothetical protein
MPRRTEKVRKTRRRRVPSNSSPCGYCGGPSTGEDHVPPRSFFPGVPRDTIPAIPACTPCNARWTLDDEYVRNAAAQTIVMRTHVLSPELRRRAEHAAARHEMLARSDPIRSRLFVAQDVRTPGGIAIAPIVFHQVDKDRKWRFSEHVIRGLYFHEFKQSLPSSHMVTSIWPEEITINDPSIEPFDVTIDRCVTHPAARHVAGGHFDYGYSHWPESTTSSVWAMRLWGQFRFWGVTHPIGTMPNVYANSKRTIQIDVATVTQRD